MLESFYYSDAEDKYLCCVNKDKFVPQTLLNQNISSLSVTLLSHFFNLLPIIMSIFIWHGIHDLSLNNMKHFFKYNNFYISVVLSKVENPDFFSWKISSFAIVTHSLRWKQLPTIRTHKTSTVKNIDIHFCHIFLCYRIV